MARMSRVAVVVLALGLVASGVIGMRRLRVEGSNHSVALVLEWNEVRTLAFAASSGGARVTPAEALRHLRANGVTGVAISETTLAEVRDAGRVFLDAPGSGRVGEWENGGVGGNPPPFAHSPTRSLAHSPSPGARLGVPDRALAAQIATYLNAKRGPGAAAVALPSGAGPAVVTLRDSFELVKGTGVGFPPEAVDAARRAGVEIVARIGNYPGITAAAIEWMLAQLQRQGVRSVIFTGTDVLGNKDLLADVVASLKAHDLNFGFVEFGKQKGDTDLARQLGREVVRVHSITDAEMGQITPPEAADRFVKAARERDIRIAYVRLYLQPAADVMEANGRYLDAIARGLRAVGLRTGPAAPYQALWSSRPLLLLAGAGVVAGTVMLLARLFVLPEGAQLLLLLVGIFGSSALLGVPFTMNLARKGLALLAALVFPTLSLLLFGDPGGEGEWENGGVGERENGGMGERGSGGAESARSAGAREQASKGQRKLQPSSTRPLPHSPILPLSHSPALPIRLFLRMSIATLAGSLLIVGLLGDSRFLIKYDQFIGIKAAHLLPLLGLVVLLAAGMLTPASTWAEQRERARAHIRSLLSEPVFIWQVLALGAALVVALLLVLRTGNDPGVGVSPMELKIRAILDRILYVRPRTKEFLIGHPAMIVALWAALSRRRWLWAPALLLGAIGQVSLINTFCHIHTPLALSLARVWIGIALGAVLGGVVVALLRRLPQRVVKEPAP